MLQAENSGMLQARTAQVLYGVDEAHCILACVQVTIVRALRQHRRPPEPYITVNEQRLLHSVRSAAKGPGRSQPPNGQMRTTRWPLALVPPAGPSALQAS